MFEHSWFVPVTGRLLVRFRSRCVGSKSPVGQSGSSGIGYVANCRLPTPPVWDGVLFSVEATRLWSVSIFRRFDNRVLLQELRCSSKGSQGRPSCHLSRMNDRTSPPTTRSHFPRTIQMGVCCKSSMILTAGPPRGAYGKYKPPGFFHN